jgi:hypothetical protein
MATPTFPADVQTYYGLATVPVDPPNGCRLCHTDDIGGTPTTLRPFGRLLYTQLSVLPYDDQSVRSALMQLDTQYPTLAAAIKSGGDPNNAPTTPSSGAMTDGGAAVPVNAIPADPIPEYGCTIGRARLGNALSLVWPIGSSLALLAFRRHRRHTRCARAVLEGGPPRRSEVAPEHGARPTG